MPAAAEVDAPPSVPRSWCWLFAIGLVAAIAVTFWPPRDAEFVFDDIQLVAKNRAVTEGDLLGALFGRGEVMGNRPVTNFALALQHLCLGGSVFAHRVVSVVLHVVAALLAFVAVRSALRSPAFAGRVSERRGFAIAAVATAIWALHPLTTDAVAYTIQQSMLLMGICAFGAVVLLHRVHAEPERARWRAALVATVAIGMACKEEMVPAPLVLILWQRAFLLPDWRSLRAHRALHLQLAATWLVLGYCVASGPRNTTVGYHTEPGASAVAWLQTQAGVVVHYLTSVFWPASLRPYYDWPVVQDLGPAIVPGAIVLLLLGVTVLAWRRRPWLGAAMAWTFLWLAPTSSIVPIVIEVVAERRMYVAMLPIVALAVASGAALLARVRQPAVPIAIAAGIAIAAAIATHARVAVYRNPITYWSDVEQRNELTNGSFQAGIVLSSCAVALQMAGDADRALPLFARAAENAGSAPIDRLRYGIALAERDDHDAAEPWLRRAVRELPDEEQAHGVLAQLLLQRHRAAVRSGATPVESWLRDALPLAERAAQLAPQRASHADTLAGVLLLLGRHADAETQYRRALQLDPLAVHSWAGLSDVFVATRRLGEAQAMWRQLLTANPGNVSLRVAIGEELLLRGDRHNAEVIVREALRLDPANAAARTVLDGMLRTAPK